MHIDIRYPQGSDTKFRVVKWVQSTPYSVDSSPEYKAVVIKTTDDLAAAERSLIAMARSNGLRVVKNGAGKPTQARDD